MSFLYQGKCLDTVQRLHETVAAECPPVSGNYSLQCTPTSSQVDILATDIMNSMQFSSVLVPSQIPCDVTLADQTAFYWELVGVLVAGFAIRALIKALQ